MCETFVTLGALISLHVCVRRIVDLVTVFILPSMVFWFNYDQILILHALGTLEIVYFFMVCNFTEY